MYFQEMKLPVFSGDVELLADAIITKYSTSYLQIHDRRDDVIKIICLLTKNRNARPSRNSREANSNITLMHFEVNTKPLDLGLPTHVVPVYQYSAPTEVGRLTDVTVEELNLPAGLNEEQEVLTQQLVHDRLRSTVPSSTRVHLVELGDVEDLSQVLPCESIMHQDGDVQHVIELKSDTEVQRKALQVRPGLGAAFAWLYIVERVLPLIESLRLQGDELVLEFPNMLQKLCIVLSEPSATSGSLIQAKGFIGAGSQRNRTACRYDVYEVRDQENDMIHHIVVDEPYPIIILKSMHEEGKLSDQEYRTELRNFFSGLAEMLEASALESYVIQEDEACVDEIGAAKCRSQAEWLLSTVRKYQGCVGKSECDTEWDGPETCLPELTSVDTRTESALSTGQTVESFHRILYVIDNVLGRGAGLDQNWSWKMQLDTASEEWTTDVISTLMILTAAKDIGLIEDLDFTEITSSRFSSIQQTKIAIDLVLYWSLCYSAKYKMLLDTLKQTLLSTANVSCAQQQQNANEATDSKGKLSEERSKQINILKNILFTMITDKKYYPYDFEIQLRKLSLNLNFDVSQLQNENGESLLHAVVIYNRQPFCLPLFRLGCWKDIYPKKVDKGKGSVYEEKTADDICEILKYSKMRKELDSFVVWEKSLNLILMAARIGDLKQVERMLEYSSDLHQEQDSMGCTSLYWGVVGGNEKIVDLLLGLNVDHNIVNSRKESLLHIACVMGHSHLIKKLVLYLKMNYDVKDGAKKSALQRIAENGDEKSLGQFFECGLGVDRLRSLLAVAGHFGRLNFIRSAVEKYRVDPQSKDEAGKSAFLRAAEQGKIEVLKYLISKDFDLTETDIRRRNVLHLVADGATKEAMDFIIRELKDRKIDVRTMVNARDKYIGGELCMLIRGKDGGRDSWHYVEVSRGLVSLFLKRTRGGTVDVGRYGTLLSSGWGVDPDSNAVKDIEQRFEARRASTPTTDFDVTPLHIAAFREKLDLAIILLDSGADPNIRDKFGLTVLHTAAMRGNLAMVKLLLNKGATCDALDNLVKTPADVADDNERNDVATYIRSQKYLQPVQDFRDRILPNVQGLLSAEQIERMRTERRDIRSYLVDTLRDLAVNINEALVSLDSGPVLEETSS